MIRSTIAAALPQKIALPCCCGGSERAASAMTTALSPDRMTIVKMIEPRAAQKAVVVMSMALSRGGLPGMARRAEALPGVASVRAYGSASRQAFVLLR